MGQAKDELSRLEFGPPSHDPQHGWNGDQPVSDMHALKIPTDCRDSVSLSDNSGRFNPPAVRVYFRDLEQRLCEHVTGAELVVGCVAWLTNDRILSALSGVPGGVAIVVQKEDFLRPDSHSGGGFARRLRAIYDRLPMPPDRYADWPVFSHMSCGGDPTVQPVRCVGNHNRERKPASPRMHNKFLVFCKMGCRCGADRECPRPDYCATVPRPYAVWTGSFNLTKNATYSFENAVYIECPMVAAAYLEEFGQVMALSEPLNWKRDWCSPEWRIGT